MTRADFIDWKLYPITKTFFIAISNRIEGLKEELAQSAGIDPVADARRSGAIVALRDILDTDWFEETEV